MRIVILADPLDSQNAGVHVFTRMMIKSVLAAGSGHEFILIRQKASPAIPGAKEIIIPTLRLPLGFATFRLFFIVPFVLRRIHPDVVIEPAHFGPFNLPAEIKRVTVIHDLSPILFPQYHRWHSQFLQRLFLKRILKKAWRVVTNSFYTESEVHRAYPFTKNKTIPILLGRDKEFYRDNDKEIVSQYNLSAPFLLYVGTIEPRKNLDILLSAFSAIKESRKDQLELVFVGGRGWKAEKFWSLLRQHPYRKDIKLLGYIPKNHLRVLYSACKVFVYPSEYEGFGLPVLEAMSCGAACVVAKNSSLPEVGGEAVLYFTTGDAGGLKKIILQYLHDPLLWEKMSKKAALRAQGFSWQRFAEVFIAALEPVSTNQGSPEGDSH